MARYYLTILLVIMTGYSVYSQTYSIGSTTITFNDPSRSNRAIETDIYYPAATSGGNVPVANGQFPVIAFGHGFVMTVAAYQNIWSTMVPQGYIVALPKTEGNLSPNHTNFAKDLAFVIGALQQAGATSGNLFNGKIAATAAVMGHSMGGGAAMLSVQYNAAITAVAGLAPAETNPSASSAAQQVSLPTLILAGGNDCVTPAAQHSRLIYDNINSTCKWYLSINGGSHCQFANQNFNCSFGEATCSPSPAISRSTQQAIATEYLLPWLDFELKGICNPWLTKQSSVIADTRLTPVYSCKSTELCPAPTGRSVSSIKSSSVQFKWAPASCASSYEVRYRPAGTATWIKKLTSTNNRTVYNLSPGTNYEWQVRSVCDSAAGVQSFWGVTRTFTTASARISGTNEPGSPSASIYPNPATGFITIAGESFSGSTVSMNIINISGQVVRTSQINITTDEFLVSEDLEGLSGGIYILQLISGQQNLIKRFSIQ